MNTRFCCDDYELDSPQLGRLTDSSDAVGDPQELQRRLAEHGYLYLKNFLDRDKVEGWFTKKPHEITETFGGRWVTDDVAAGDIITFGMHLMHASTTNTTDRWRLSCDIRFQPETDTTDQRWVGQNPTGHSFQGQPKPIAQARADWGV